MKVKIKKLDANAVIPKYAKLGDAGLDLTAVSSEWNEQKTQITYGTGLAIEIPKGYVGLIFPRSSVSKTSLSLSNCVGVIDSGYRGEIMLKFNSQQLLGLPFPYLDNVYKINDRVGQLLILSYRQIELEEVNELSLTERSEGGFGSTGT